MDIGGLKRRISDLEAERNDCSKEIDDAKARRDLLNQRIRESAERIKELRAKRDETNALVQAHKDERARLQKVLTDKREELRAKRDKLKAAMRDSETRMSPAEAKEAIEKLEFEFQTGALSIEAEKKLLARIKVLERTYGLLKSAEGVHNDMLDATAALDKVRAEVEAAHQKVVEDSNISQQYHETLIELSRQMDPMRRDADESHRAMIAALERKKQINELLSQARGQFLEAKAERQAQDIAEREASLKRKAEDLKGSLKGKKRFDLRQLQVIAQSGQEFSFGGEDGNAVSILLGEDEAPRRGRRRAAERGQPGEGVTETGAAEAPPAKPAEGAEKAQPEPAPPAAEDAQRDPLDGLMDEPPKPKPREEGTGTDD